MLLPELVIGDAARGLAVSLDDGASDPERTYRANAGPSGERPSETDPGQDLAATIAALEAAEDAPLPATGKAEPVQPCPAQALHALEATILDDRDRPLENVLVQLHRSDTEVQATKSDARGFVRFEGLDPGSHRLTLPELDQDSWALEASEALPTERDAASSRARWKAPAAVPTAARTHVVVEGECTTTIAYRSGWLDDALWEAPENAALREQREHKNILAPGDALVIPAPRPRLETVAASTAVRLRRKGVVAELSIAFFDDADQPRAGEPYLIRIVSDAGTEERNGTTNAEGFVVEAIDPSTREVTIVLGDKGPTQQVHTFNAATLDPIDTVGGVQGRLVNLGYEIDDARGELGPYTRRALRDFQRDRKLELTGEIDDATRDAILALHLS
jgi:hypothetical protein